MKPNPTFVAVLALVAAPLLSAAPQVEPHWQTAAELKVPEGVLYDPQRQVLYVSNIDGRQPWEKDGAGSIGRVSPDGKILAAEWVAGLHAPKGMALVAGDLYVADVDRVVVIDVEAGRVSREIPVPGAQRLNDVSADADGAIYVSDSGTGHIHVIRQNRVRTLSRAFKSPNGVLAVDGLVYVLDQEALHQLDADGNAKVIVKGLVGHVDGVEKVSADEFIVSCWNGIIYHASTSGTVTTLVDTRTQEINAADIDFDPSTQTLYVPTFWKNTVVAYRLK